MISILNRRRPANHSSTSLSKISQNVNFQIVSSLTYIIFSRPIPLECAMYSGISIILLSKSVTLQLYSLSVTQYMTRIIVNREEGLEAGGVSDNMLKFWSRDNTSALESRLVIRAVQKIKLCLAKRLVFLPRSRKS